MSVIMLSHRATGFDMHVVIVNEIKLDLGLKSPFWLLLETKQKNDNSDL